jgi:hypothetical protein
MIPGSTPRGCLFKFVSLRKFKLAQHKWQKEEEALLYKIIWYVLSYSVKSALRAGRLFLKDSMKKAQRDVFSEPPNSVGSIGVAILIPRSKKAPGIVMRTRNCYV